MLVLLLGHGALILCAAAAIAVAGHGIARAARRAPSPQTAEASSHAHAASGHELGDGFPLAASGDDGVAAGPACDGRAPVRSFDIVAISVDITINRYLDHDPEGRMYVLESELSRVREEEQQNARARAGHGEPAVSIGLQGDAIQPLTLRAHPGECLRFNLRNALEDEDASLHIHGSSLRVSATGAPAIAANPAAYAAPGETAAYEWMVPRDEPEGTHDAHSYGNTREQTSHGLFGAVIIEPAGARFLDPRTGAELDSGWDAVIVPRDGPAFREFALFYHEFGDENYQLRDRDGGLVPQVDPLTKAYRPGGRALNYRSEPFMNRLALQQATFGSWDESAAYSSYTFGDPATPMMRAYLGDPVKQRVIHGGSEVLHVHHVHGGAIRWRRQPGVENTGFTRGLDKHPPIRPEVSERTDSQSIAPSETFDIEAECGSGGCQQSVGDFLVHCHVGEHYFAGMWGIWRVYNTLQDGPASTDALPPLTELSDRPGRVLPALASEGLIGATVESSGAPYSITADNLSAWVERQLPPRGVRRGYDASVFDWQRSGDTYVGEPEESASWPGYTARRGGERRPLRFDPATGKLAYPFLQPHLGQRPPFSPGHSPAPFLDPVTEGPELPQPGANGPASICPLGTRATTFPVEAITLPIAINERANLVDPAGQIFVLRDQEDEVRADNALRVPLAIRANAGEDCVDLLLRSRLEDGPENNRFSKVNMHIHFVQFDVQASDGVVAGFNYEQSVRPFAIDGETIEDSVTAGEQILRLGDASRFQPGVVVGVGMDRDATFEVATIRSIDATRITLDRPLRFPHDVGEIVSTEFVRYRWYPDVQSGTAYFHDHVNALSSWKHGLFGALTVEPPGSTYHDPETGAMTRSGPIADVHTTEPVSIDVAGSFRELVLFMQDDNPVAHLGRSTGGSFNLRAEPLAHRGDDPARVFSSTTSGDPETPILRARLGDPIVIRALVGGTNDVHTLHVDGHWFREEPYSATSPPVDTTSIGISERKSLVLPAAGGVQRMPGDYLFYNGRSFKLGEGSWGILRVLTADQTDAPLPLPGRNDVAPAAGVCPDGAPQRRFEVVAVDVPSPMLGRRHGKVFVLRADERAVSDGTMAPEPLVLHVNVGDCLRVELTNGGTSAAVTFHVDMVAADPLESGGVEAGRNPQQAAAPGETRTYEFYADPQLGETVALVRDWGDVAVNPNDGRYGAIIVGPRDARYRDPHSGADVSDRSSWQVDVRAPGRQPYRDVAVFFHDEDEALGNHRMPYASHVSGSVGVNYRSAPLESRAASPATFQSAAPGDPPTPLIEAYAGDLVAMHVIAPASEQAQAFSLEGHAWPLEQDRQGSSIVSSRLYGGLEAFTLTVAAGGPEHLPGDYQYGAHREPYREAGAWGLFRVHARGDSSGLEPLDPASRLPGWTIAALVVAGVAVLAACASLFARRRLRAARSER